MVHPSTVFGQTNSDDAKGRAPLHGLWLMRNRMLHGEVEFWRRVGRFSVTVPQPIISVSGGLVLVECGRTFGEVIEQQFEFFSAPQAGHLAPAAGATAGQYRCAVRPFLLAAIGDGTFLLPVVPLFLSPAATGAVSALRRRTAADVAVPDAFPGHGMGDHRRTQGKRRQRTRDDDQVDRREKQRYMRACGN